MPLPQALLDSLPPLLSQAAEEALLEKDCIKNYKNTSYTAELSKQLVASWREKGFPLFCTKSTIFVLVDAEPFIEFHALNAGTGGELVEAVNELLHFLQQFRRDVITFYDNPKINKLLPGADYPYKMGQVNRGVDHTYETIFYLKESSCQD